MITIIQSQNIHHLFTGLRTYMRAHTWGVFEEQHIVVPSHGVGEWVKQQLAIENGICAQVKTSFLGSFQWQLYSTVLDASLPRNQPISAEAMQWSIFAFLQHYFQVWLVQQSPQTATPSTATTQSSPSVLDPLFLLLTNKQLPPSPTPSTSRHWQTTLWTLAGQIAQVFAAYVVYRQEWLEVWQQNQHIDIPLVLQHKHLPSWLLADIDIHQAWQAYVWHSLFGKKNSDREAYKQQFWHVLQHNSEKRKLLPPAIFVFLLQQLPPAELQFLNRLAQYTAVYVLHYNPSQAYWADVVDARWLKRQKLQNPALATRYDSDHPLLTRFGKQARDVFRQLVTLSGQEDNSCWIDSFVETTPTTLLAAMQQDILMLNPLEANTWTLDAQDHSFAFHACYTSLRQLEVLYDQLCQWFAADASRKPSDVVIFAPDLAAIAPLIRMVFDQDSTNRISKIPYSIAGVADNAAVVLWQSVCGFFTLLDGRFCLVDLMDWLNLPPILRSFNLTQEDLSRLEALLLNAGFTRGFDTAHLANSLQDTDTDYRFTFKFAIDRLMLAIAMPTEAMHAGCMPAANIGRNDVALISLLAHIYTLIDTCSGLAKQDSYCVLDWLDILSQTLNLLFEAEITTDAMLAVQRVISSISTQLAEHTDVLPANQTAPSPTPAIQALAAQADMTLPLTLVLDKITSALKAMPPGASAGGRVTFSRLGTIRPLPFKLIAILDLNQGEFPAKDIPVSFNLINMLPPNIGDPSRTADDLGALLDAILLAQDACWFFYNGFEVDTPQPRQPAAVVEEMLEMLSIKVRAQVSTDSATEAIDSAALNTSPVQTQLCFSHPQQPFDSIAFVNETTAATAGIWYDVACTLTTPHPPKTIFPFLPNPQSNHKLAITTPISTDTFIAQLLKPAKCLLDAVALKNVSVREQAPQLDFLVLNPLEKYKLLAKLLTRQHQAQTLNAEKSLKVDVLYDPTLLPIGAASTAYIHVNEQVYQHIHTVLTRYGGALTPTKPHHATLFGLDWQMTAPDASASTWISANASRGNSGKHKLRCWLQHLFWQVARQTTPQQVALGQGNYVGIFKELQLCFPPIAAEQAISFLQPWLDAWQHANTAPFVLPPSLALGMFKADKEEGWRLDIDSVLSPWLHGKYHSTPARQDENCALHPDWQLVLTGMSAEVALRQTANTHAQTLYLPLLNHLEVRHD